MAFLNIILLLGSLGIAVPIVIHILNRKSAQRIFWGAMRFLRDSLVSRRRKILLEEMLLLGTRCLLVMLVVFAMARPFVTPGGKVPWLVILPLLLASVVAFGITFALWRYPKWRTRLLLVTITFMILAMLSLAIEEWFLLRIFGGRGTRDIALIIDASDSMELVVDGVSNFDRALEEAANVIKAAPLHTAFSVVVGASVPYALVPAPITNRDEILAAIGALRGGKGNMRGLDTLALSALMLAYGNNPSKQVILFTDGQRAGWRLDAPSDWDLIQEVFGRLPAPPPVFCRVFGVPPGIRNATVTAVDLSRAVVGLDREVGIQVTVTNTGTETITPGGVTLTVGDGEAVYRDTAVGQIAPGAFTTVLFRHRFKRAGPQVLAAQVLVEDDLPGDDIAQRVVMITDHVPVLIVDGNPSGRFIERASAFAALALAPRRETVSQRGVPSATSAGEASADLGPVRGLVKPDIIDAPDVMRVESLDEYSAVILADVPRLPTEFAALLAAYVRSGGALLVASGPHTNPAFFNGWFSQEQPVLPGRLVQLEVDDGGDRSTRTIHPALATFSHPALRLFQANPGDLPDVVMTAHWRLDVHVAASQASVGARLSNGDPFIIEQRLGRGRVLQLSCSLDARSGSLPLSRSFVPFMHQLLYYLAAVGQLNLNMLPAPGVVLDLPLHRLAHPAVDQAVAAFTVHDPFSMDLTSSEGGYLHAAPARLRGDLLVEVELPPGIGAGLYNLAWPQQLIDRRLAGGVQPLDALPMAIIRDPAESRMDQWTPTDIDLMRRYIVWQKAESIDQLQRAMTGQKFGQELWKPLAVMALLLLVAEIALTRWIARRRQTGQETAVEFEERTDTSANFKKQVAKLKRHGN